MPYTTLVPSAPFFFFATLRRRPRPPLFPYTTLFRSAPCCGRAPPAWGLGPPAAPNRSEEHTSELQSRRDLVCRLLLEKKKNRRQATKSVPQVRRDPLPCVQ